MNAIWHWDINNRAYFLFISLFRGSNQLDEIYKCETCAGDDDGDSNHIATDIWHINQAISNNQNR